MGDDQVERFRLALLGQAKWLQQLLDRAAALERHRTTLYVLAALQVVTTLALCVTVWGRR